MNLSINFKLKSIISNIKKKRKEKKKLFNILIYRLTPNLTDN